AAGHAIHDDFVDDRFRAFFGYREDEPHLLIGSLVRQRISRWLDFRVDISFARVQIKQAVGVGARFQARVRPTDDRFNFLAQHIVRKSFFAANLDLGYARQGPFRDIESDDQVVVVNLYSLDDVYVRGAIAEVLHVRPDSANVFLEQRVVGKPSTIAAEKRQKPHSARLGCLQFLLHVDDAQFVGPGDPNVRELQAASKNNFVSNVEGFSAELRRV